MKKVKWSPNRAKPIADGFFHLGILPEKLALSLLKLLKKLEGKKEFFQTHTKTHPKQNYRPLSWMNMGEKLRKEKLNPNDQMNIHLDQERFLQAMQNCFNVCKSTQYLPLFFMWEPLSKLCLDTLGQISKESKPAHNGGTFIPVFSVVLSITAKIEHQPR